MQTIHSEFVEEQLDTDQLECLLEEDSLIGVISIVLVDYVLLQSRIKEFCSQQTLL